MLRLTAHAQAPAHGRARAKIRDAREPHRALMATPLRSPWSFITSVMDCRQPLG